MIPAYRELRNVIKTTLYNVVYANPTVDTPLKCFGNVQTAKFDMPVMILIDKTQKTGAFLMSVGNREYKFNTEIELRKAIKALKETGKGHRVCTNNKPNIPDWRIKEVHDKIRAYIFEHDIDKIYTEDKLNTVEKCFAITNMWWKPYPNEYLSNVLRGMFGLSDLEIKYFCDDFFD